LTAAFIQRLRELGWIDGRTIAIEYRWPKGRSERYTRIGAEFVRLKVDVVVAGYGRKFRFHSICAEFSGRRHLALPHHEIKIANAWPRIKTASPCGRAHRPALKSRRPIENSQNAIGMALWPARSGIIGSRKLMNRPIEV
jgi:hypothetical protein